MEPRPEILGLAIDRDGVWIRRDGEVVCVPLTEIARDPREAVALAQRDLAERSQRAAGRQ